MLLIGFGFWITRGNKFVWCDWFSETWFRLIPCPRMSENYGMNLPRVCFWFFAFVDIFAKFFAKFHEFWASFMQSRIISVVFTVHAVHLIFIYRVFFFDFTLAGSMRPNAVYICDIALCHFFWLFPEIFPWFCPEVIYAVHLVRTNIASWRYLDYVNWERYVVPYCSFCREAPMFCQLDLRHL